MTKVEKYKVKYMKERGVINRYCDYIHSMVIPRPYS